MIPDTKSPSPETFLLPHNCSRCGKDFFSSRITDRICPGCLTGRQERRSKPRLGTPLTLREKQVVALVRDGKRNREIGAGLYLTEGTIKEYLNRIFQKLPVSNRIELAVWATRNADLLNTD